MDRVGAVAIGRNEGRRLEACLRSLASRVRQLVYVDSGSTDGSPERARALGAQVVELDMSIPFTAARARNAGWTALASDLEYVMFVDGDCEVVDEFIDEAARTLDARQDVAVVCGRRRERHPERSIYNLVCDIEWDTPVGEAEACGGDALMRLQAVRAVDGYDPELIAGEEPDLCLRMRRLGWKVLRIDVEMTLHDADIHALEQWWRRARRSGFAFAAGSAKHGDGPERHWVDETRRTVLWGAIIPSVALGGALPTLGTSLGLLSAYPLSAARIFSRLIERGRTRKEAATYAALIKLGHFAEAQGVAQYYRDVLFGRASSIIEYKKP